MGAEAVGDRIIIDCGRKVISVNVIAPVTQGRAHRLPDNLDDPAQAAVRCLPQSLCDSLVAEPRLTTDDAFCDHRTIKISDEVNEKAPVAIRVPVHRSEVGAIVEPFPEFWDLRQN